MELYSIQTAGQLQPYLDQEWLLANGLGGFASSTVVGCNTRRYHGLLVAATLPPVGRVMALNRVGELLHLDGRADPAFELSISQFDTRFHPRGDRHLEKFELGDVARWHYLVEGVRIIKEMRLLPRQNTVSIRYRIDAGVPRRVELILIPFLSLRDFHALRHGTSTQFDIAGSERHISVSADRHTVRLWVDRGQFFHRPDWWTGQTYAIERQRGLDDSEDLFVPGQFTVSGEAPFEITLFASMEKEVSSAPADRVVAENPPAIPAGLSPVQRRLYHAADAFIVRRRRPDETTGCSIIAGYPWFSDWGRDTMISLPGLLLTTRRFAEAAEVLSVFAQYVSEGMIPNCFDDYSNQPHYNTVDASLWFIHAVFEYLRLSGDRALFDTTLLPACRKVFEGYRAGTRFNIGMDPADGLIAAGDASTQLTWMDAKNNGVVFTPRQGKAVEINALWHNALMLLGEVDLASRVAESFRKEFWFNPFRGLYDVVDGNGPADMRTGRKHDLAIRPNQIFAVSLPHSPLTADQQAAVVEVVRRELLTPFGLRTLSPADPGYRPVYGGNPFQRDSAYHNGTVWPWLMGPYLDAYLRVHNNAPAARAQARQWLQPLIEHMSTGGCIGQISEIFDADAPHHPNGTPAQAWSVAEVLRLAAILEM